MITFLIGFLLGAIVGFFVYSLCKIGSDCREAEEKRAGQTK